MKAYLRFDLNNPDDRDDHETALKAGAMKRALDEIGNEVFRPARKHGYSDPEIRELMDALNGGGEKLVDLLEKKFYEILEEYEIKT